MDESDFINNIMDKHYKKLGVKLFSYPEFRDIIIDTIIDYKKFLSKGDSIIQRLKPKKGVKIDDSKTGLIKLG